MADKRVDWPSVIDRVVEGDSTAFLQLSRLITGFLTGWRAFDFRDDWDDVIQEVVIATVQAVRAGKIAERRAVVGYVRTATRNKFVDRIRARRREAPDTDAAEAADAAALHWPPEGGGDDLRGEVWDALQRLPEKQQQAVVRVYAEGRTYEEASDVTGIPLGSLKRYLRLGLAALHDQLSPGASNPESQ